MNCKIIQSKKRGCGEKKLASCPNSTLSFLFYHVTVRSLLSKKNKEFCRTIFGSAHDAEPFLVLHMMQNQFIVLYHSKKPLNVLHGNPEL
jgi:hypothetical protein